MPISVIIPAFNEERFLPQTLDHLRQAEERLQAGSHLPVEIVVVDNASTDRTSEVACTAGAKVISVPLHNIARVRNAGAGAVSGDPLIFLDADTLVPVTFLSRIVQVMDDPACLGGAADTDYRPARPSIRLYLQVWRVIGIMVGMAQGAAQFCRRHVFAELGGYDETIYMGEDVDFYWRMRRLAKMRGEQVRFLTDVQVRPSCRRFDQWPTIRTLVQTNPVYIGLLRRHPWAWQGWYDDVPR